MAYNPACLFGSHPTKGEIAVGGDGDLVVVDMETEAPVSYEKTLSEHQPVSRAPPLVGWPVLTVRRGEIIFRDGEVLAEPGSGRVVERSSLATVAEL